MRHPHTTFNLPLCTDCRRPITPAEARRVADCFDDEGLCWDCAEDAEREEEA